VIFRKEPITKMAKIALFQNNKTMPNAIRLSMENIEIKEVELKNFWILS
jgi:hypothetical protein